MCWTMPYSPRGGSVLSLETGAPALRHRPHCSSVPPEAWSRDPRELGSQPSARERERETWVPSPWPLTAQTRLTLGQWVPDITKS